MWGVADVTNPAYSRAEHALDSAAYQKHLHSTVQHRENPYSPFNNVDVATIRIP